MPFTTVQSSNVWKLLKISPRCLNGPAMLQITVKYF